MWGVRVWGSEGVKCEGACEGVKCVGSEGVGK